MNKYQEALDTLRELTPRPTWDNPMPQDYNEEFFTLEELINNQEKYRWHDLRKNPDDLPNISEEVLVDVEDKLEVYTLEKWIIDGKSQLSWEDSYGYSQLLDDVIKWKYIEGFEDD